MFLVDYYVQNCNRIFGLLRVVCVADARVRANAWGERHTSNRGQQTQIHRVSDFTHSDFRQCGLSFMHVAVSDICVIPLHLATLVFRDDKSQRVTLTSTS